MGAKKNETMKNYQVYFEIFDKKLKATVKAESEADAKKKIEASVIKKIKFLKVEGVGKTFDEKLDKNLDSLRKIFGI